MRNGLFATLMLAGCCLGAYAQSAYDDDIYYDPKRDTSNKQTKRNSNYIRNMADMDVDTYNRRGQYYASPVDTIGETTGNGEDFIYTQQIQKYYNPTIVVDNADLLGDILANSYGNVDVVINNAGIPVFAPWSYSPYYYNWPYYNGWSISFGNPWFSFNWGWGPSWSWGPSWGWGPAWNWGWGPSWAWGPSWGWGPGWDWGPGWRPGWGGPRPRPDYRPHGNRPVGPGGGWAADTRPGYNHNGPGYNRPHRVSGANGVVRKPDGKWEYARPVTNTHRGFGQGAVGTTNNAGHRVSGWGLSNSQDRNLQQTTGVAGSSNRGSGVSNTNTHRQTGVSNTNRNTNTNRNSYNTNRNNSQQNRSYNNTSRSYNNSRSGYGSGGSHRSGGGSRGGGGGSRGRHR